MANALPRVSFRPAIAPLIAASCRSRRLMTEGSFDGFVWGTVERKAHFIAQVMRGRLDVREIEDVGDVTLSFQEVKALATGNPLLLEQAKADAELARLECW